MATEGRTSIQLRIVFDGDVDGVVNGRRVEEVFGQQLAEVLAETAESGGSWGWGTASVIAVEIVPPTSALPVTRRHARRCWPSSATRRSARRLPGLRSAAACCESRSSRAPPHSCELMAS